MQSSSQKHHSNPYTDVDEDDNNNNIATDNYNNNGCFANKFIKYLTR